MSMVGPLPLGGSAIDFVSGDKHEQKKAPG